MRKIVLLTLLGAMTVVAGCQTSGEPFRNCNWRMQDSGRCLPVGSIYADRSFGPSSPNANF
jgi:hypothetical protein